MCDNSRMGNLDLVKNSFAAEPEKQTEKYMSTKTSVCVRVCMYMRVCAVPHQV